MSFGLDRKHSILARAFRGFMVGCTATYRDGFIGALIGGVIGYFISVKDEIRYLDAERRRLGDENQRLWIENLVRESESSRRKDENVNKAPA